MTLPLGMPSDAQHREPRCGGVETKAQSGTPKRLAELAEILGGAQPADLSAEPAETPTTIGPPPQKPQPSRLEFNSYKRHVNNIPGLYCGGVSGETGMLLYEWHIPNISRRDDEFGTATKLRDGWPMQPRVTMKNYSEDSTRRLH